MSEILNIVLPVFGMVAVGYICGRVGLFGDRVTDGLADYVFLLAIPALIFKTVATVALPAELPWGYWLAYFGGVAVAWSLALLAARLIFGKSFAESVIAGMGAGQGNIVMIGIPLILTVFGPAGAVPITLLLAVNLPVNMLTATLLIEGAAGRGKPIGVALGEIGRALVTHPVIIGIALGMVARGIGEAIPKPLMSIVDSIAGTTTATALIATGLALRRYGFVNEPKLAMVVSLMKLVVHPLVVLLIARAIGLDAVWTGVAVLFATAPSGVQSYTFAMRYKLGVEAASTTIAFSTVACALTASAWLAYLKP